MCTVCGCGSDETRIQGQPAPIGQHHHDHHPHAHGVSAAAADGDGRLLRIEQDILAANDAFAGVNRARLAAQGILALNFVSSPGSGKTTLLARTLSDLSPALSFAVIEGDQQTSRDAERIRAAGAAAVQVNTGKGCHLDAHMVGHALDTLAPADGDVLFIENVGNLVCPAAFDLGEALKVVVLSVTEGDDKPLKYPDMFHAAGLMLLTKTDLLPHVDFDPQRCLAWARRVNPDLPMLALSARSGDGLSAWYDWLSETRTAVVADRSRSA